jgi:hypothetical protein
MCEFDVKLRPHVQWPGWDLLSDEGNELAGGQQLRWPEGRPPGGQTAITLVLEDEGMTAGSMKGMILRASSLESAVAYLAERGVVLAQETQEMPWVRYTGFRDPDGNSWVIQELRS